MLKINVKLLRNPWEHSFPTDRLMTVLKRLARERSVAIDARFQRGEYLDDSYETVSFAIAVMDPTCPPSIPSEDAVLAIIEIGDHGSDMVVNGLDKACVLRDFGVNGGMLLFGGASPVLRDGRFRWGHGSQVEFLQGGGSGLNQLQDRYETSLFLADLVLAICEAREEWGKSHPIETFGWFCDENTPSVAYDAVLARQSIA